VPHQLADLSPARWAVAARADASSPLDLVAARGVRDDDHALVARGDDELGGRIVGRR
jgi:hypothetical protein